MNFEIDVSKLMVFCLVGMAVGLAVAPTIIAAAYGFVGGFGVWLAIAAFVIYMESRD